MRRGWCGEIMMISEGWRCIRAISKSSVVSLKFVRNGDSSIRIAAAYQAKKQSEGSHIESDPNNREEPDQDSTVTYSLLLPQGQLGQWTDRQTRQHRRKCSVVLFPILRLRKASSPIPPENHLR